MFAAAIAYVESKTPTWIKVSIALVIIMWMAPLELRDWAKGFVQAEVHATIMPMKKDRDNEIKDLNKRIDVLDEKASETSAFVKAIALEQLGAKRYQQVELTTVDNTK